MSVTRSWMTALVVAAALCALGVTTTASLIAIQRSIDHVTEIRSDAGLLVTLRDAVYEEAFAEAGYRRAPNDESWQRLLDAVAAVPSEITTARVGASRTDNAALTVIAATNARYVEQVLASKDQVGPVDDRVAGPALDSMRTLLQSMIDRRRDAITAATTEQENTIRTLSIWMAVVFALAAGLLAWVLVINRRQAHSLRAESEAHRAAALTDALTGLPNRVALFTALDAIAAQPETVATMMFLDLDGFKAVNDLHGHTAGDVVLQEVAARLRAAVSEPDMVARLGGDEFAILVTSGADPNSVGEAVLATIREPFSVGGAEVMLGVSIGVADSATVGHEPIELMRASDAAVYRAKGAGGGRVERQSA